MLIGDMRAAHSQTANDDDTLDTFEALGLQANRIVDTLAARPCRASGENSETQDEHDKPDDHGDSDGGAKAEDGKGGDPVDNLHGKPLWNP